LAEQRYRTVRSTDKAHVSLRIRLAVTEKRALPEIPRKYVRIQLAEIYGFVLCLPGGAGLLDRPVEAGAQARQPLAVSLDDLFEHRAGVLGR
jgi:hypothetical protein